MSWIFVRPGERRSCVGCHHARQAAPPCEAAVAQASLVRPLRLQMSERSHRFRGNNAAVTGLMEMQFDRYREICGLNRHAETTDPGATGKQEVAGADRCVGEYRGGGTNCGDSAVGDLQGQGSGWGTGSVFARS